MLRVQNFALGLSLTLAVAGCTAVTPVIPLRDMSPDHACLFLCHHCLAAGPARDLLYCANTVCGRIVPGATCGPVLDLDMMWLGHRCGDFRSVARLMTGGRQ